jgi:hypothetical protein
MKKQTSSGMPQISAAFAGWMTKITLLKHTEQVVDGFVKIQQIPICFSGTIQPLSNRAIALKPEGQRSWTWLQIHCFATEIELIPGDRLTWNGDIYKVMELKDYSLNGYIEYQLTRDFQTGGSA